MDSAWLVLGKPTEMDIVDTHSFAATVESLVAADMPVVIVAVAGTTADKRSFAVAVPLAADMSAFAEAVADTEAET